MKMLGDKVLIKKIDDEGQKEGAIFVGLDEEYLPKAEVISVSSELQEKMEKGDCPKPGDKVYYIHNARQPGRVRYNELDHFAVSISQIVSII